VSNVAIVISPCTNFSHFSLHSYFSCAFAVTVTGFGVIASVASAIGFVFYGGNAVLLGCRLPFPDVLPCAESLLGVCPVLFLNNAVMLGSTINSIVETTLILPSILMQNIHEDFILVAETSKLAHLVYHMVL
jgi:hypothetical protein